VKEGQYLSRLMKYDAFATSDRGKLKILLQLSTRLQIFQPKKDQAIKPISKLDFLQFISRNSDL
jgi:hypothetical protein